MPVIINPDIINKEIIIPGLDQWPGCNIELLILATVVVILTLIFKKESKLTNNL